MDSMTSDLFASVHEGPWLNASFEEEAISQPFEAQSRLQEFYEGRSRSYRLTTRGTEICMIE
jgi:hypothetical protein